MNIRRLHFNLHAFLAIALLGCLGVVSVSGQDKNTIVSRSFKNGVAAERFNVSTTSTQVQYFDGLGRPLQSVVVGQSPAGGDVVQPIVYDAFGREVKKYLPYTSGVSIGSCRSNAISDQAAFYSSNAPQLDAADLSKTYTEVAFEASPLNRTLGITAPGAKSLASVLSYGSNQNSPAELLAKRYDYTENTNILLGISANNNYAAGALTYTKSIDENAKIMLEFKDKDGRVVLKRALISGTTYADTYYIYDNIGQLRAVLQPQYQTENSIDKFAFLYRYDDRGRLIEKKVPGASKVEMVYDNYNRLAMSRDGNQSNSGLWGFVKYDVLNRTIMTGELANNQSADSWRSTFAGGSGHHEDRNSTAGLNYSLGQSQPVVGVADVLTVSYFDNYDNWLPSNCQYLNVYGIANITNIKGQPTGGRTRVLNADGSKGAFLTSALFYDDNYRPIQSVKDIFNLGTGMVLRVSSKYKYAVAAVVEQETEQQLTMLGEVKIRKSMVYDHADRLLEVRELITKDGVALPEVLTSSLEYNELGQLKSKWLHSSDVQGKEFRRKMSYVQNIRGWQTLGEAKGKSKGAEFVQMNYGLSYQNGPNYTNGNINAMSWTNNLTPPPSGTPPSGGQTGLVGGLSFTYDGLNRLTDATGNKYEEKGITYDKNGNILTLIRTRPLTPNGGTTTIDNLVYSYPNGNQLAGIIDNSNNPEGLKDVAGVDYAYDANGNLTKDGNKGIAAGALQYNYLNLTRKVTINGKILDYVYDASGQKLQLQYSNGTANELTRYVGSVEWFGSAVKRITTPDGQYIFGSSPSGGQTGLGGGGYQYNLTDHLGNVRVVFDEKGTIIQRTDYYPFGLQAPLTPSTNDSTRLANKYLFLNRELQPETGNFDLMKRQYDPLKGRFDGSDPSPDIEGQESLSTYQYGWNNPILKSDPNGDCPNCLTAAVGAGLGALIGGGIEAGMQLYHEGKVSNWSAVGGAALQGGITGGVAGFTGGASLLATVGASAGANVVGGAANRTIQGQGTTLTNIVTDATVGAVLGAGGKLVGNAVSNGTNNLSNSTKGKLGEAVSEIKYGAQGYKSAGNDVVKTGGKTATGRQAEARFDHKMTNIFTGKQITVESKFNTSGLTPNQNTVVKQGYNVIIDKTTSQGLGNGAKAAVVGTGAGVDAQRNN